MNSKELEKQHGKLLPLRDKFWYDNTANQFREDLLAIKQDILKYELGLLPKGQSARCWQVCINAPVLSEETAWTSSGTIWSRMIHISYIFFYVVDEPQDWFYKLHSANNWKTLLNWNYWKNPKFRPVWHTHAGCVARTITL